MSEKDRKGIVCRLFFDSEITNIPETQKLLEKAFKAELKCESYYKFEGWYELSFYIRFSESQNEALDQTLKKIGGDWMTIYCEDEEDYSAYAIWNPEMGGDLLFPGLKFGDVSIYIEDRKVSPQPIKIMLDHDCWPLWTIDGDNCSPDKLPISVDLQEQLISWSDKYDNLLNRDDPINSYYSIDAVISLEKEGLILWSELRSALGVHWKVSYHSITKNQLYETLESYMCCAE